MIKLIDREEVGLVEEREVKDQPKGRREPRLREMSAAPTEGAIRAEAAPTLHEATSREMSAVTSTVPTQDFILTYARYGDVLDVPREAHELVATMLLASALNGHVQIQNGALTIPLDFACGCKATACLFGPNPTNSWPIVLLSHSVRPISVKVLFYLPLNLNKNISTYTPPVHIGTLA